MISGCFSILNIICIFLVVTTFLLRWHLYSWASQVALVVKNPPANTGDSGSIPGSGRSPGGGNGNPLQYSCLENPTDRGAWQDRVYGVAKVRHDLATKPPPFCLTYFGFCIHSLP